MGRAVVAALFGTTLGAGAGACAPTVYMPTQPSPQFGPGVMAEILSVHGAANQAELAIHSAPASPGQPAKASTLIGPITWSPGDRDPCSGAAPLTVVRGQGAAAA